MEPSNALYYAKIFLNTRNRVISLPLFRLFFVEFASLGNSENTAFTVTGERIPEELKVFQVRG